MQEVAGSIPKVMHDWHFVFFEYVLVYTRTYRYASVPGLTLYILFKVYHCLVWTWLNALVTCTFHARVWYSYIPLYTWTDSDSYVPPCTSGHYPEKGRCTHSDRLLHLCCTCAHSLIPRTYTLFFRKWEILRIVTRCTRWYILVQTKTWSMIP